MNPIRLGSVITFIYDGGSHPGDWRTLKIENYDNYNVGGMDLDIDKYRNFNRNKMRSVREVFNHPVDKLEDLIKRDPRKAEQILKNVKKKQQTFVGNAILREDTQTLTVIINGRSFQLDTVGIKVDGVYKTYAQAIGNLLR